MYQTRVAVEDIRGLKKSIRPRAVSLDWLANRVRMNRYVGINTTFKQTTQVSNECHMHVYNHISKKAFSSIIFTLLIFYMSQSNH